MLFILEIVFLIMGVYGLITAKLPPWFVGKGYYAEGSEVRLLSDLMIVPLPLAFCAGLTLGIIDQDLIGVATVIEIASIVIVAIIVTVVLRRIRKPAATEQTVQNTN